MMTGQGPSLWTGMGPALGNHLWQSTLFAVTAWLATLLLRKNKAQVRYRLWLAASLKFLVPCSLLISLGALLPKPQPIANEPRIAVYSALDEAGRPFSETALPAAATRFSAARPRERLAGWLPAVLATGWFCGAVTVVLVWCARWRQVAAAARMAAPAESGREVEILRRLEKLSHIRMMLRRSQQMMEPGIFGIFRPVLLWPERLSGQLDEEQIEAILTHEMIHALRRDNLTAMVHMLVEAAFWFHPMVWWMERCMKEERERACDEAAVQLGGRPEVYAESLLKACRFCIESPLACVSGITGAGLNRRIRSIMTLRPERLSRSKKLLLGSLGLSAALAPVAFGVMREAPVYLQILPTTGPRPSFEVATVKPSKPDEAQNVMMGTRDGYLSATHMSLRQLIKLAYQIKLDDQLVGASGWMDKDYFNIEAKAGEAETQSMRKLGVAGSMEQFRLMLQSLLEGRFQLKVSSRVQELPAYALVVAKGGPKLKEVAVSPQFASAVVPPPPAPPPPPAVGGSASAQPPPRGPFPGLRKTGPNQVTGTALRMSWLADWLLHQGEVGNRVVVDETGLKGNYDFVLNGIQWEPSALPGATPTLPDDSAVSIFTALQEQLGLKLIPTKAPVEVLVINHAEQPSAN